MAGIDLISTLAVSVNVLAAAPALPAAEPWQSAMGENFSSVVEQWASRGGLTQVEIAPGIANLSVGGVQVKAQDVCAAIGRLVAGLRHAAGQPRLAQCDAQAGLLRIVSDTPLVASIAR